MTHAAEVQAAELESPEDAGEGARGDVQRWLMELELADKVEENWRKCADEAVRRYRDETEDGEPGYAPGPELGFEQYAGNRFNILYSNVNIITAALYGATPKPDVRRRYRDEDPQGKEVAEVLERSLAYTIDAPEPDYDFDLVMEQAVKDMQLPGRGVARVWYRASQDGAYEAAGCRYWPWKDFRRGPGRVWGEVPWVAYRHLFTRKQAVRRFGKKGREAPLDYAPEGMGDSSKSSDVIDTFKRMEVWEIWDKRTRKVVWVAPSYDEAPMLVQDDPLNLQGFFDCPRPLYAVWTTESLVPIEPFRFYREQAAELSENSKRIDVVMRAVRARMLYDPGIKEDLEALLEGDDADMVPVENSAQFATRGGLENAIWFWPIEKVAASLKYLYEQREAIKQAIYEIIGISDIMRGSSDARETLGAQRLKAQFGVMPIDKQRGEVERFARDIIRLKAEIIAEKFSPQTLTLMTQRMVDDAMMQVMKSDGLRGFRIDIETDQTAGADLAEDQKAITELLAGIASFVQGIGPAVESGYMSPNAALKLMMAAVRRHKLGREVEDALEEEAQKQLQQQQQGGQQQGPSEGEIEQQKAAAEAQAKLREVELKAQASREIGMHEAELRAENQRVEIESKAVLAAERQAADIRMAERKLEQQHEVAMYQAEQQARIKEQQAKAMAQQRPKEKAA